MHGGMQLSSDQVQSMGWARDFKPGDRTGGASSHRSDRNGPFGIQSQHETSSSSKTCSSGTSDGILRRYLSSFANSDRGGNKAADGERGEMFQPRYNREGDKPLSTVQGPAGSFLAQLLELGNCRQPQSCSTPAETETFFGSKSNEVCGGLQAFDDNVPPSLQAKNPRDHQQRGLQGGDQSMDWSSTSALRELDELLGERVADMLQGQNSVQNWIPPNSRTEGPPGWSNQTREVHRGSTAHPTSFGEETGDSRMERGRRRHILPSSDLHSHSTMGSLLSTGLSQSRSDTHVNSFHVDRGSTPSIQGKEGISKLENCLLPSTESCKGSGGRCQNGSNGRDDVPSRNSQVWGRRVHPYPAKLSPKNGHCKENPSLAGSESFGSNQETSTHRHVRPHTQNIQPRGLHEDNFFRRPIATMRGYTKDSSPRRKESSNWLRIRDLPKHVQKIVNSVENIENVFELERAIGCFTLKKFVNIDIVQKNERDKILEIIQSACMTQDEFLEIFYEN